MTDKVTGHTAPEMHKGPTPASEAPGFDNDAELATLYSDFERAHLAPLWTQRAGLMPASPASAAVPHTWRWSELGELARRAGRLVKVGRGGERRAIALANPGLGGAPSATPNLWAAIQYLGAGEHAPAHRHSQTAFRFVIDGEGVWTNVDGDAVAMSTGDLLLTPGWHWHEHHNVTDSPMMWLDGLDIPLIDHLDAGFFQFGSETLSTTETPARSRSERLWAHAGLRPLGVPAPQTSPLMAYRWAATNAALAAQLELEAEGQPGALGPGHAAVRFTNPATGQDALRTIRLEMHRIATHSKATLKPVVGSSVWQVVNGAGSVTVGLDQTDLSKGDLITVPSWMPVTLESKDGFDLFRFSDDPVYEALGLANPPS